MIILGFHRDFFVCVPAPVVHNLFQFQSAVSISTLRPVWCHGVSEYVAGITQQIPMKPRENE
jgi:hypothetical protein